MIHKKLSSLLLGSQAHFSAASIILKKPSATTWLSEKNSSWIKCTDLQKADISQKNDLELQLAVCLC